MGWRYLDGPGVLDTGTLDGGAWGVLNGFLVSKAKIPSFIVTLGTLGMSLGSALLITGGVDERDVPFKLIETIGSGRLSKPRTGTSGVRWWPP